MKKTLKVAATSIASLAAFMLWRKKLDQAAKKGERITREKDEFMNFWEEQNHD